ncbi:hypothetical protein V5P93_003127 [Actinokineospora auranticolor]|uniref:Uncharacterized protein n=1 Tax=Actinokineospora auranticolor TaxID=155976 RepID=A0A2S6H198_9PSEU|nr:hypothetical protein [Actinokineospora auranticolor]PPK71262.1 hypothetical protein CLV40_101451 [Actinokineospora auranticolor]
MSSLYDHLRQRPDGLELPDGGWDGVLVHHGHRAVDEARADEVAEAVRATCAGSARLPALYEVVAADDVVRYFEGLAPRLADAEVGAVGRWLATTAADRGAVKVGLVLLGIAGSDPDVVRVFAAHDEFTLYCAAGERELWRMALAVRGWGRIHCVERLRGTRDPEIREWILRGGFRNTVSHGYLALIAAETGGLAAALRGPVDRDLLTAAGEILLALIEVGPADGIRDYGQASEAIDSYLAVVEEYAPALIDFLCVEAIRGLDGQKACARILADRRWDRLIAEGLSSSDPLVFRDAARVARGKGIDTFEEHVRWIWAEPGADWWVGAWEQADADRARGLIALPGPIAARARGLRAFPGIGGDVVLASLRGPEVYDRGVAMETLAHWPRSAWPAAAEAAVEELARDDPEDQVRRWATELLAGRLQAGDPR